MLWMFAGSVVDSALIVSALRRVVCQDALEAALAESLTNPYALPAPDSFTCGLDLILDRCQVVVQFSLG
jgi:hypothetical protein